LSQPPMMETTNENYQTVAALTMAYPVLP
jgi:hypothetical protein